MARGTKTYLTKKQLEKFRERLEAEKREILRDFSEYIRSEREADPHRPVGDSEDLASEARTRELTLLMSDRDREQLREIEDALRRIEQGTYGICEESGEEIPVQRLEAIPTARYTVAVQEEIEAENLRARELRLADEEEAYTNLAAMAAEEQQLTEEEEEE